MVHDLYDDFGKYAPFINRREQHKMFRSSAILLSMGIAMLAGSISMNLRFGSGEGVVRAVLIEGLVIAAWMSVWEGLAALLMNWPTLIRERRIYRRLANAAYSFRSPGQHGAH